MIIKKKYGLTLIEVMLTTSIFLVIMTLMYKAIFDLETNTRILEGKNKVKDIDYRAINKIGNEIQSSRMFMGRPASGGVNFGNEYTNLLNIPTNINLEGVSYTPINSRVLPVLENNMPFSKTYIGDTDTPFKENSVGNTLFFASVTDNALIKIGASNIPKSITLYQFHYYFLAKADDVIFGNNNQNALSLLKLSSNYYADYSEIKQFESTEYTNSDLYAAVASAQAITNPSIPISGAWNYAAGNICSSTPYFYALGAGGMTPTPCSTKISTYKVSMGLSIGGRTNGLLYTVARNTDYPSGVASDTEKKDYLNNFPASNRVPLFAPLNPTGTGLGIGTLGSDGYPHGFEVMMSGTNSGRLIYIRSVRSIIKESNDFRTFVEMSSVFQGKDG